MRRGGHPRPERLPLAEQHVQGRGEESSTEAERRDQQSKQQFEGRQRIETRRVPIEVLGPRIAEEVPARGAHRVQLVRDALRDIISSSAATQALPMPLVVM